MNPGSGPCRFWQGSDPDSKGNHEANSARTVHGGGVQQRVGAAERGRPGGDAGRGGCGQQGGGGRPHGDQARRPGDAQAARRTHVHPRGAGGAAPRGDGQPGRRQPARRGGLAGGGRELVRGDALLQVGLHQGRRRKRVEDRGAAREPEGRHRGGQQGAPLARHLGDRGGRLGRGAEVRRRDASPGVVAGIEVQRRQAVRRLQLGDRPRRRVRARGAGGRGGGEEARALRARLRLPPQVRQGDRHRGDRDCRRGGEALPPQKSLKALLALLAAGKLGSVLLTGGTMIISVFAYALVFGFWYAVGFVLLIFVHEMGHFLAARQRGLAVGAPTFIPFVGAWIELKDLPHDVETEAWVGLAGPLLGTVGALGCYYLYRSSGEMLFLALAYAGFFINLFNLIPISPFDGGRITAILSPRVWLLGAPILVGLFLWSPSPLLILMAVLAAPQLMKAWKFDPNAPENAAYYSVAPAKRFEYALYYVALAAFLGVMSYDVHEMLASSRR